MRDKGPWHAVVWGSEHKHVYLASEDFTHDVCMRVMGDFRDLIDKKRYVEEIAAVLNKAAKKAKGA